MKGASTGLIFSRIALFIGVSGETAMTARCICMSV